MVKIVQTNAGELKFSVFLALDFIGVLKTVNFSLFC